MRNDSTNLIRTITGLAAPAVFGLTVLACGSSAATVESDARAVSAPRSADAVERSAIGASVLAYRSADALEHEALALTVPSGEGNGTPRLRYI